MGVAQSVERVVGGAGTGDSQGACFDEQFSDDREYERLRLEEAASIDAAESGAFSRELFAQSSTSSPLSQFTATSSSPASSPATSSTAFLRSPTFTSIGARDDHFNFPKHYSTSSSSSTSSRRRIHPIVLIPTFLLGIILSNSLLGTGRSTKEWGKGEQSFVNEFRMSNSNNKMSPLHPTSRAANTTLHTSGHLFLDPSAIEFELGPSSSNEVFKSAASLNVRHPIHDLILNATDIWQAKLGRQSKTLLEAVVEYKRRFGRNPPKGFDDWFSFAQDNSVVLIDEFDNTFNDILPFFALSPFILQQRSAALQDSPSTFTMDIRSGNVEITGSHGKDERAIDQAKLMKRWSRWVGDVNITMSVHDGPSIMMDFDTRKKHIEAAKRSMVLSDHEADTINDDASLWGFSLACPSNSRIRRTDNGLDRDVLPLGPSFVADHVATMNLCENPEWQYLHGFTSWAGTRPKTLQPLFSFAKTSLHSDILLAPLEQFWDKEKHDPAWELKPHNKAIWRGSTTGVWFDRGTWWRSSQRVRLFFTSRDRIGKQKIRFERESGVLKSMAGGGGATTIIEREVPTKIAVDRYLDFGFAGKLSQCTDSDGSCEAVKEVFDFSPPIGWNEANEFKYMLDLDGNAWSGRFHRLLASNSVVLKSTIFPEWYSGWIQPWVHYIPIKIDYSDLFDVMSFFSGDLEGFNGHEAMAKKIAQDGKSYTDTFWRYQDMEAYFFRLSLEWARCASVDRKSMDYTGPGT